MQKDFVKKAFGAVRNRTADFKGFRSGFKSQARPIEFSQREVKFAPQSSHINFNEQPRDCLPPEWVDVYDKINEDFEILQDKSKNYSVKKLKEVQQEKQKKVFGEHSARNKKIEGLLEEISKVTKIQTIMNIEGHIKNFASIEGSENEQKIRKNIQKKLVARLKELTGRFKVAEDSYMSLIQKTFEVKTDSSGLFEVEKQEELKIEKLKNEEIRALAENFAQVAEVFKELNYMIVDQGTILDRIDYCLVSAKDNMKKANVELIKAENNQKCTRATNCLLILIVLIVLLLLTLIFKNT